MNYLTVKQDGRVLMDAKGAKQIAEVVKQLKELKDAEAEMKKILLAEMESYGIKKFENEEIRINYIEGSDRETFDKKTFAKDHPDIYDEYVSFKPSSAYVKVAVK